MKLIFLDIDGVLNSQASEKRSPALSRFNDNPDPTHIKWLNLIIQKTGAKIVISSTWRKSCGSLGIWRLMDLQGFKGEIIGSTPDTGDIRGEEIRCWMTRYMHGKDWRCKKEEHGDIERFCIIDDDRDMGNLSKYLVQTNGKVGLTKKKALEAIELLGGKENSC